LIGFMALISLGLVGAALANVFKREPGKQATPESHELGKQDRGDS
jgi:hypothetical protein